MGSNTILVVEDEPNIASLVELYLAKEGYSVVKVDDGGSAIEATERLGPSLVVLDLMLPGMDGFEVCRRIRTHSSVPIIMLTAKDQEVDKVVGLELGADDYITKPFSPRELVARVKAVLRRSEGRDEVADTMTLGDIFLDVPRRKVIASGQDVDLTPKEFDLLAFLVANRGIVFTRDRLLERVWNYERVVDTRTVDSHIKALRGKLGGAGEIIRTVRGVGYKCEA